MARAVFVAVMALTCAAAPRAQNPSPDPARQPPFDQILDTDVRDGWVYYRALKAERGKLDGYVGRLASTNVERMSRDEQVAFWLNAYDALVLQTVIDHYPIVRRTGDYPAKSIRQIPGAFERAPHLVAGRTLTLDQIEQTVLPTFGDPRVFFAISRASVGGGRLRSETFQAASLERQLSEAAGECASRVECVQIDASSNRLLASPIFSWREKDFVSVYASKAEPLFASRSPIERGILAFVQPKLLPTEREFLSKNAFQVAYKPFDWTLNDLTGRGDR